MGRVAIRFKMLTYCVYAPLLNRIDALPLNAIYNSETASGKIEVRVQRFRVQISGLYCRNKLLMGLSA
jgi:hypothetical protein